MNRGWVIAVLAAGSLVVASSASATSCSSWRRMTESQRWDYVYRMIDDAIAGQKGRQYQVNRAAIARCLEGYADAMYRDFDDACFDSRTAGSGAIRGIFKRYIWSCIR